MSLAEPRLRAVRVLDPVVDINENRVYCLLQGGAEVTWKPNVSTSFSQSSAQWSAPPPSPAIIIDRKVYMAVPVTINFAGNNPIVGPLLQSGVDAFRAYPLQSIMNTLSVTINNTTVTQNISDTNPYLLRYHNPVCERNTEHSLSPSMMDQSQNYVDLMGGVRNPLAGYADSASGADECRGAFPLVSLNNPSQPIGAQTASLQAILTEPLMISPMCFENGMEQGFVGVQTFTVNATWNSNLARIWSHMVLPVGQNPVTNFTVTVTLGQPTLYFKYITPKQLMGIPRVCTYPYFVVDRYPTNVGSVASGALSQVSSSNIQLNSIPRKLYIFARKQNNDLTFLDTDTFLGITQVSVNWNNRSGLLSAASQQDLYNISRKNGVNMSWQQWSGGPFPTMYASSQLYGSIGSMLCLEFGTDIGLSDTECPGELGTFQLQVNVTLKNINPSQAITPTLYMVVVSEGIFTIEENRSIAQIGIMSKEDVLNAQQMRQVDYNMIWRIQGGSFLSSLKSFGQNLLSGLKSGHDFVKKNKLLSRGLAGIPHPYAQIAAPIASLAGYGKHGGVLYQDEHDYCEGAGRNKGGKMMSRKALKKRM